jgi:hypothetical protein
MGWRSAEKNRPIFQHASSSVAPAISMVWPIQILVCTYDFYGLTPSTQGGGFSHQFLYPAMKFRTQIKVCT